ncbi:MAG: methionine--tRNA ligase [Candidatus Latescibacteria bacterium]|nr:methionine--tRNA ligase [Candidatus Latescibacterota bacterium]
MAEEFYITTAIDYANDLPHVGTAYEKICADVIARYKRLAGYDVYFTMGNDEHSINVKKEADRLGYSDTAAYCDEMAVRFEEVWRKLHISYSDFIRTTEPRHRKGVQKLFRKIHDAGDIYKGHYEGWYCESCEAFLGEKDLVEGLCPHHKRKPEWIQEENYFFALSKYQDRLLDHITAHPDFIRPESRRNEILSLIRGGLEDISISRASFDWGIPLPMDPSHVIYVWIDALSNYITVLGYGEEESDLWRYWPADLHLIGKDITRFHCVIWPAMLLSAGIRLPKTIFGHGFIDFEGRKMSKSLRHVVQPLDAVERYGADALRYFLLREVTFGQDGDFSWERFEQRYNADLANDLGNLVSRAVAMVGRYFEGVVPGRNPSGDRVLMDQGQQTLDRVDAAMSDLQLHTALGAIWELVRAANRFVEVKAPWMLAKDPSRRAELATCLYDLLETLRHLAVLLHPFMPKKSEQIWRRLGLREALTDQRIETLARWDGLQPGTELLKGEPLFPRIESEKKAPKPGKMSKPAKAQVDIAAFGKLDLRVAVIKAAEPIPGADKLLKLRVDLGSEQRQLVAGIAQQYEITDLIGKRVVVIANLEPATIRGVRSEGMLLAAGEGKKMALITPDREIGLGARVR